MKTLKITFILLLSSLVFTSCMVDENSFYNYNNGISLNDLLQSKDLWYVDYNQTQGNGDVRFMSLAFTLSFINGNVYANNNLVGLGNVGNGYGDQIGYYGTNGIFLEIDHDLDGYRDFEVLQLSNNRLKFISLNSNVSFILTGYNINEFDFDAVFYDNIEYFLQEYNTWYKTETIGGVENVFDYENYLAFIPENINRFLSSQDPVGVNLNNLIWDFSGNYEVFDVQGTDTLKVIELDYDQNGIEEFELSILSNRKIKLYHITSDTTYIFEGSGQIIYKREENSDKTKIKTPRKRFKVKRKVKTLKKHIKKISNRAKK